MVSQQCQPHGRHSGTVPFKSPHLVIINISTTRQKEAAAAIHQVTNNKNSTNNPECLNHVVLSYVKSQERFLAYPLLGFIALIVNRNMQELGGQCANLGRYKVFRFTHHSATGFWASVALKNMH